MEECRTESTLRKRLRDKIIDIIDIDITTAIIITILLLLITTTIIIHIVFV